MLYPASGAGRLNSGVRRVETQISALVEKCATDRPNPLMSTDINDICVRHSVSRKDFYDRFARYVATEFAAGRLSYEAGDAAMNDLFGHSEHELQGFAWAIFLAFDEGEFLHDGDPPDIDNPKIYTLPLVLEALARCKPHV